MDFFKQNIIPGEVFVQLTAFLIVFFVLKKLAWGPILEALQSRRDKIKTDFDRIDEARKEIEALKEEYAKHLQTIDEQAREKLLAAVHEGENIAKNIQEKARSEAQATFEKSKENLKLEIAKARLELRREIVDLTIKVSEKVIGQEIKGSGQDDKVMAMLVELEKSL